MNANEAFARARELAHHALEVSPELADAHVVLQQLHAMVDWDWAAAERENRLALSLDSTDQNAYQTAGIVFNALGRWEEAEQQFEMALARDPLNSYLYYCLGKMHYGAGRYATAEAMFRKQWEMDPTFRWSRPYIAKAMTAQGKTEAAFKIIEDETDPVVRLMSMAMSYYAIGRHAEADAALREQVDGLAEILPVSIAMAYAQRGEKELALQWLEKAYDVRDATLLEIVGEPLLKNIEGDPRYKAFLRNKMNIPATWQRQGRPRMNAERSLKSSGDCRRSRRNPEFPICGLCRRSRRARLPILPTYRYGKRAVDAANLQLQCCTRMAGGALRSARQRRLRDARAATEPCADAAATGTRSKRA
jgi:tetratricopeptide (TPR) repeat protein